RRLARIGVADDRHGQHLRTLAGSALHFALPPHGRQLVLENLHAFPEQAAVGLQLRFTRPAQSDTTFLPLQVSPAAHQARRQMLELRKLDLQLAFMTARTLRKYIQDQTDAIDDAARELLFEIALLRRRELMIEDDQRCSFRGNARSDLHYLALA